MDFDVLAGKAVALLGITPQTFFDMSPKEFYHALKVTGEQKTQLLEFQRRLAYEVARFQAMILLAPHIKNQIHDPKDLVTFSWERAQTQTVDEMKAILLRVARAVNRKFDKNKKNNGSK